MAPRVSEEPCGARCRARKTRSISWSKYRYIERLLNHARKSDTNPPPSITMVSRYRATDPVGGSLYAPKYFPLIAATSRPPTNKINLTNREFLFMPILLSRYWLTLSNHTGLIAHNPSIYSSIYQGQQKIRNVAVSGFLTLWIKKFSSPKMRNRQFVFTPKIQYNLVAESFAFTQDKLREANQNSLTFPTWCAG